MMRAERNTESAHGWCAVRLAAAQVDAVLAGAILVLVSVGGQRSFLADMSGRVGAAPERGGLCGSIGLVRAELGVFPLYTVLAWLLVVALDLSLPAGPTSSA